MPAKVNPVIPEAVAMAATQVMAYDAAVGMAGASGSFQLNVMLPLIAHALDESIALVADSANALAERAIPGLVVHAGRISESLARNPMLLTALAPRIGYDRAAQIAKRAAAESRPVVDVAAEETGLPREDLARFDCRPLAAGGPSPPELDRWCELVRFECRRAAEYYDSSSQTEQFLAGSSRRLFRLMHATYRALLAKIERDPASVFTRRQRISRPHKAWLAVRTLVT